MLPSFFELNNLHFDIFRTGASRGITMRYTEDVTPELRVHSSVNFLPFKATVIQDSKGNMQRAAYPSRSVDFEGRYTLPWGKVITRLGTTPSIDVTCNATKNATLVGSYLRKHGASMVHMCGKLGFPNLHLYCKAFTNGVKIPHTVDTTVCCGSMANAFGLQVVYRRTGPYGVATLYHHAGEHSLFQGGVLFDGMLSYSMRYQRVLTKNWKAGAAFQLDANLYTRISLACMAEFGSTTIRTVLDSPGSIESFFTTKLTDTANFFVHGKVDNTENDYTVGVGLSWNDKKLDEGKLTLK